MIVYWSILIWAIVFSLIFKNKFVPYTIYAKNEIFESEKYPFWVVALTFFALWFFAGYRTGGVGDTSTYIGNYIDTPTVFEMPAYSSHFLFEFLRRLSKAYISSDPTWWLFLSATLSIVPICAALSEFSLDLCVSVSFLIFSGVFEYFFNGARQLVAISICLYAMKYLVRKKTLHYILLVLLASLFHASALVMLIAIILYRVEPWSAFTTILIFVSAVMLILPNSFTASIVSDIAEGTDYSVYANQLQTNGTNPVRAIVYAIPTILAYVYRNEIKEINDPVFNFSVNMSLINSVLYVFGIFYNALVVTRIAAYFIVFLMYFYPYFFKYILKEETASYKYVYYIMYFLYFYYQMVIVYGGLKYVSSVLGIRC